jgi:hypothetical protein
MEQRQAKQGQMPRGFQHFLTLISFLQLVILELGQNNFLKVHKTQKFVNQEAGNHWFVNQKY